MQAGLFAVVTLAVALGLPLSLTSTKSLSAQTDSSSCSPQNTGPLCKETKKCYFWIFCGDPIREYWPSNDGGDGGDGPDEPSSLDPS